MRRAGRILFVAFAFVPCAASPQGDPLGPEFRVNAYTTYSQGGPAVASDSSGNFVVVWESDTQDGSYTGIFGQRYASTGAVLGPEFRVNTFTTYYQFNPAAASDASGNFVVVWQVQYQDGSHQGVFGQRYASTGAPLGPEFRVNTYTTNAQSDPAVASDSSGNFVVVWRSYFQDGLLEPRGAAHARRGLLAVGGSGVFGQRYASTGAPLGPEFRVNTYTTRTQNAAAVASDSSGNFVVVWHSYTQDGSDWGVFGQRYASSGAPLSPEFRVNSYTSFGQTSPSVASDSSGNFVVVWWNSWGDDIFGQRYSAIVPVELTHFEVE